MPTPAIADKSGVVCKQSLLWNELNQLLSQYTIDAMHLIGDKVEVN